MGDKDYLANFKVEEGDRLDFGIKGMKWGVRNPDSAARARLERVASGTATTGEKVRVAGGISNHDHVLSKGHLQNAAQRKLNRAQKKDHVKEAIQISGPETPAERYTRLLAHAKKNGSNALNEDDLKFVTSRGDALTKVDRLNSTNPHWVSSAANQAIKQAAKTTMQAAVTHATKKYITTPLLSKAK